MRAGGLTDRHISFNVPLRRKFLGRKNAFGCYAGQSSISFLTSSSDLMLCPRNTTFRDQRRWELLGLFFLLVPFEQHRTHILSPVICFWCYMPSVSSCTDFSEVQLNILRPESTLSAISSAVSLKLMAAVCSYDIIKLCFVNFFFFNLKDFFFIFVTDSPYWPKHVAIFFVKREFFILKVVVLGLFVI